MKKVKRNLFLFFSILTLVAVMFTACPSHVETRNYKTLTLHVQGEEDKKLYYENGAWYKTLTDGKVSDKVEGDNIKFELNTHTWTVTFKADPEEGGSVSKPESPLEQSLTLKPENIIASDGKVSNATEGIKDDTTVTGTYEPKAIGEEITATPKEGYEFDGWYNGETKIIGNVEDYKVSGDITLTAKFTKNTLVEQSKVLTIGENKYYYKDSNR